MKPPGTSARVWLGRRHWAQLVLSAMLATIALASQAAPTCQKISEICNIPGGTRMISGVPVTRDCWGYEDVFQCVDPSNVNYCSVLQTDADCSQSDSVCTDRAFNGDCLTFVNTFDCRKPKPVGPGLAEVARNFTITKDQVDEAACSMFASNPKCAKTGRVCKSGPQTRNINELDVYKDCWEWEDTYSCAGQSYLNFCQAVAATPGCTLKTDVCGALAPDGSCLYRTKTFDCGVTINDPQVVLLNTSYTIAQNQLDPSQCTDLANSVNCAVAKEVCAEGPGTRNIGGLDVYKDCWRYERSYTCIGKTMTSDCGDLIAKGCTKTASTCTEYGPDGTCSNAENVYQCKIPGGAPQTVQNCGGQLFCMNGNCFDTGYQPDKDFMKATTAMEAGREGSGYFDQGTLKLFNGIASKCGVILGSLGNCCKPNTKASSSNRAVFSASGAVMKVAGEFFKKGSAYVYDSLMNSWYMNAGTQAMLAAPVTESIAAIPNYNPGDIAQLTASPTFSFYGASFSFSLEAGVQFVSFDPVSFALQIGLQIIMQLMACDQNEQLLAMRRGQNLCEYVGSYCSDSFLGACLQRKQVYCCFNSRLMRIIATEGRKQLGRGWGAPKAPTCEGFTDAEIAALDFSQMNFDEFYADILHRIPDPTFRGAKNGDLIQQRVNNYFTSGKQNSPPPNYAGPPQ